jgi:chemotaxis protein CheD
VAAPASRARPAAPPSGLPPLADSAARPTWQVQAGPGQQVVLMPGQMSFTTASAQLRTLLGSCVSITVWHPTRRIGGMCHYLLPQRQRRSGDALDGRYGDEAMEVMVDLLLRTGTRPSEYVAHLYGGADTMPEGNGLKFNVGERNIERGWTLIDHYGFQLDGVDVGEDVPRTVAIDLASGRVDMRRGAGKAPLHPGLSPRGAR